MFADKAKFSFNVDDLITKFDEREKINSSYYKAEVIVGLDVEYALGNFDNGVRQKINFQPEIFSVLGKGAVISGRYNFPTFNEIDMTEVMDIRKIEQNIFKKKYNIKLGFMSFFAKAVIEVLKEIPEINSEIYENEIVYKNYFDLGIAIGSEKGLVVPIIRDVDNLSFAEIEQKISELSLKANTNKLAMADLSGGTFSITNGGVYGSMMSTPIINPPQSAILGMHNIVERPIAVNGEVVIRPVMYIALSYDHRIIDGKESVSFLYKVKEMIENPMKLMFGAKEPEEVLLGL